MRRVNQAYVIATSTKIDIGSVDSSKLADKNFTATTLKKSKQSQEDFFGKDAEPQKKVIACAQERRLLVVCFQRQLTRQQQAGQRRDPALCHLLPSCFSISGLCYGQTSPLRYRRHPERHMSVCQELSFRSSGPCSSHSLVSKAQ